MTAEQSKAAIHLPGWLAPSGQKRLTVKATFSAIYSLGFMQKRCSTSVDFCCMAVNAAGISSTGFAALQQNAGRTTFECAGDLVIKKIRVRGYRIHRDLTIYPNRKLNLIVGANESGKSTLMEAIVLALTGRINGRSAAEELNPHWFNTGVVADFITKRDRKSVV